MHTSHNIFWVRTIVFLTIIFAFFGTSNSLVAQDISSTDTSTCTPPQITSAIIYNVTVNYPFDYLITTAHNTPSTQYSIDGTALPEGLSMPVSTVRITGVPTEEGFFFVPITVDTPCGSQTQILNINVLPDTNPTDGNQNPVVTNTPPVITLVGTNPITLTTGATFTDPGATATDAEDGNLTSSIVTTGTVNTSVPGTYTITYTVTDSKGASASVTRTVVIKTPVCPHSGCVCFPPMITSGFATTTYVGTFFSYKLTVATTTAGTLLHVPNGSLPSYLTVTGSTVSGVPTAAGIVSIPLYVENPCGAESKTLTLTVLATTTPNTPPVITLVGTNPITLTTGATFTDPGATATDAEDGNLTSSIVTTGTVNTAVPGTYTITYTVTDSKGASASVTRTVVIKNAICPQYGCVCFPPMINGPFSTTTYVGDFFSYTLSVATATPQTTYAIDSAFLPSFFSVSGSTTISGIPTYTTTLFVPLYVENPCGADTKTLTINVREHTVPNTPPVITLVGTNPITLTTGATFTDPGATATDAEDGNLTSSIVTTGTVNTAVPGTYTITYTVTDSKGASASVTRTVVVENAGNGGGGGNNTGKITFCLIVADADKTVATSSAGLPTGTFTTKLGTSTDFANNTVQTQTWNASAFNPNRKFILGVNDADCVTWSNLPFGMYYYPQLAVAGAQWINNASTSPVYNDQYNQPVNNTSDFFPFSIANDNSNGEIRLDSFLNDRTLVMFALYTKATTTPVCLAPEFISPVTASVVKGQAFSYILNASSTTALSYSLATSSLPAGLSYDPVTHTISGTPTVSGTFTIAMTANSTCGTTTTNLVLTVTEPNNGGGGNGGGGNSGGGNSTGGGGNIPVGNGPIVGSGGGAAPQIITSGGGSGSSSPAPTTPAACFYLRDFLRKDFNNDPAEVTKLQVFLRDLEGMANVPVNGIYDDATEAAVRSFQLKYRDDILTPWGHTDATGYTYILTKKKVNEIYCQKAFPVTALEQQEIDTFRAFLQSLRDSGVTVPAGNEDITLPVDIELVSPFGTTTATSTATTTINNVVGSVFDRGVANLANVFSVAGSWFGKAWNTVLESGKQYLKVAFGMFALPTSTADIQQCFVEPSTFGILNLILAIIILIMGYLWYREKKTYKKIEEVNKEIDLK